MASCILSISSLFMKKVKVELLQLEAWVGAKPHLTTILGVASQVNLLELEGATDHSLKASVSSCKGK